MAGMRGGESSCKVPLEADRNLTMERLRWAAPFTIKQLRSPVVQLPTGSQVCKNGEFAKHNDECC